MNMIVFVYHDQGLYIELVEVHLGGLIHGFIIKSHEVDEYEYFRLKGTPGQARHSSIHLDELK